MFSFRYNVEAARDLGLPPENEAVTMRPAPRICRAAEPRLAQSLVYRTFMIVNDCMLVKGIGDVIGTPLEEMAMPDAQTGEPRIVRPGIWYRPQQLTRERIIEQAFDTRETYLDLPGITRWIESRPIDIARVLPEPHQDIAHFALQSLAGRLSHGINLPKGLPYEGHRHICPDLPEDVDLTQFWAEPPAP